MSSVSDGGVVVEVRAGGRDTVVVAFSTVTTVRVDPQPAIKQTRPAIAPETQQRAPTFKAPTTLQAPILYCNDCERNQCPGSWRSLLPRVDGDRQPLLGDGLPRGSKVREVWGRPPLFCTASPNSTR